MPTYIALLSFTDQGIHKGKNVSLYWTQGSYDVVATIEMPNEESAMAILLTLGSLGNMRSQTLRAFTAKEMKRIVGKMK